MTIRINELIIRAEIENDLPDKVNCETESFSEKEEVMSIITRKLSDDKKSRRER